MKTATRTKAGVWIDHRRAILVMLTDRGEEIALIESGVEKHPSRSGDSPLKGSFEAQQVPADDSRQRAFTGHLNVFYDAVIAHIANADAILILGPGEARGELAKRIEKGALRGRVRRVDAADKMTRAQIAAKVRKFFAAAEA